jgi:tRNA dimethylallyltransferase
MPTLYFLIGPTSVGKSELALEWAGAHGAEILYCDAFCVYRGMDIGTAKPDKAEQAVVPHHGLDLVDVDKLFSIADYVAEAKRVVEDCARRGVPLLVSGGSGFYLRSFFYPVLDDTNVSDSVREAVASLKDSGGLEGMVAELKRLNPAGVRDIDLQNPRRVQNALERCMASGKPLGELQQAYRDMPPPFPEYEKRICLLSRGPDDLWERIQRRTKKMLECGLIDEVRRLREAGLERNKSAASSIGYREVLDWLESGGDMTDLEERIAIDTRQLVKKQRGFFKNQLPPANVVELLPGAVGGCGGGGIRGGSGVRGGDVCGGGVRGGLLALFPES